MTLPSPLFKQHKQTTGNAYRERPWQMMYVCGMSRHQTHRSIAGPFMDVMQSVTWSCVAWPN